MNREIITLKKIDGIYDIQPPISASMNNLEIFLITLMIILIISALLYAIWNHYYSTKGQAKRNIKKLRIKFISNKIDPHDAAYQLSFYLRKGLKLNHIGTNTHLPEKLSTNECEWKAFNTNISDLRYSKNIQTRADINTLFENSLLWLKLWP